MMDDESYELSLEHAKSGYSNAQETVRFVDTKTGVITGIVTLTTGLPFVLLQWLFSTDNPLSERLMRCILASDSCMAWAITIALLSALGILFGTLSIIASTSGLMARMPKSQNSRIRAAFLEMLFFVLEMMRVKKRGVSQHRITTLFPLYPPERLGDAQKVFRKVRTGKYSKEDILDEYALQLESIGYILSAKIRYNGDSVKWFTLQCMTYCTVFILAILALYSFATSSEWTEKPKTESAPQQEINYGKP